MHEPTDHTLTPAERELESALRSLAPAGGAPDACELAYRMGEMRGRSAARRWQAAAGTLAAVALAGAFGTVQGLRRSPSVAEDRHLRIVDAAPRVEPGRALQTEQVDMPIVTPASSVYVRQRARALALGAASLGTEGGAPEHAAEPAPAKPQKPWDFFLQAFGAGGEM